MNKTRVAINGLGRIGRLVLRTLIKRGEWDHTFEVVAVNDLAPADNLAYLLNYDSTHGQLSTPFRHDENSLILGNKKITVLSEKDPAQLPWKKMQVDLVIESTGLFTSYEGSHKHLEAGAKKVIISAPASKDEGKIPTLVMGVNHLDYRPQEHHIVSNASCTTNCLAPLTKVVHDQFEVVEALMSTIHAVTATQVTVDGTSKKDWRGGRGAYQNIIPASTGAAKALALCMPDLKGKITGMSFRVPVADVSVVDLTVKVKKKTTYQEITQKMREASETYLKGILSVCEEELVSTDFVGSHYSSVFDVKAGLALNENFFKLVAWYDNEMGYSHRVCDLLLYIISHPG